MKPPIDTEVVGIVLAQLTLCLVAQSTPSSESKATAQSLRDGKQLPGDLQRSAEAQGSSEAQRSSIEKQKASVRRQVMGAVPQATLTESSSWFTNPWPAEPVAATPVAAVPAPTAIPAANCDPMPSEVVMPLIKDAAARENVKEELVRAVMERESAFRPCAVSPKGAQGLMQLMPATAAELGVKDAFDPKQNVDAGTRYLKQLLDKYQGKVELALAAYNAGQGRVDRQGGVPPIEETRAYILNIMSKFAF